MDEQSVAELHSEINSAYETRDANRLVLALKTNVQVWAKVKLWNRGESQYNDGRQQELEQLGVSELVRVVPAMFDRKMDGPVHIIRSARVSVMAKYRQFFAERLLVHVPYSTSKARFKNGRTGMQRFRDMSWWDPDCSDPLEDIPSLGDEHGVTAAERWTFIYEVRDKARELSTGSTHAAIERLLSSEWVEAKEQWLIPDISKVASQLGINRRTLADRLRALALPIAKSLTTESAEIGSLLLGERWPKISGNPAIIAAIFGKLPLGTYRGDKVIHRTPQTTTVAQRKAG